MGHLPRIRPGLVSVTFRRLSPREIVERAVRCGLEGIEWGGDVHASDVANAREARRMTEDAGLVVAAYGSYWRADGPFAPVAEIAIALGAPTIRVWAGVKGPEDADEARVADALRAACDLAPEGTTVSLEYHGGTLTETLASTLRLAKRIDHPSLRLYWQPAPERPHAERLEEVRALLPWLSNLHVFQWTRSAGETLRHPLAKGEAEWRDLLDVARGDRFALLEFVPDDDPDLLFREAATLRRWLS